MSDSKEQKLTRFKSKEKDKLQFQNDLFHTLFYHTVQNLFNKHEKSIRTNRKCVCLWNLKVVFTF